MYDIQFTQENKIYNRQTLGEKMRTPGEQIKIKK